MRVFISERAAEDLARIYAFIAVRNPDAAEPASAAKKCLSPTRLTPIYLLSPHNGDDAK